VSTKKQELPQTLPRWEVPDSWEWVSIADVGQVITGNTPSTSDKNNYGNDIPYVKPPELVDRGIRTTPNGLSEKGAAIARTLPAGAVLVSCIGGLGKTGLAKVPVAFNQQINAIIFNECVIPEYGFYYAQTLKEWLQGVSSATTLPIVNKGKFQRAPIPIAPLEQQKRIVAEIEKQFSRLDEAVANLKRVKANLKRYKAAVLKAAVEGKLTEEWRKQHPDVEPADKLLERILAERREKWQGRGKYKEPAVPDTTDLPELPEGWVWVTLDSLIAGIEAGKSFKCDERTPDAGEVGVVKVSAVTWGEYDEHESKTCLDPYLVKPELFVRTGDFLFSRANTIELVGACVIARNVTKKIMLSDKILRWKLMCGFDRWVLHFLRSSFGRSEIERLATGNQESMRNIGQNRIRSIRIPLPPVAEREVMLTEVERCLTIIAGAVTQVDDNLRRSERLRQSILKKAFQGELC
jgi:type I restriction enzyme S subunit